MFTYDCKRNLNKTPDENWGGCYDWGANSMCYKFCKRNCQLKNKEMGGLLSDVHWKMLGESTWLSYLLLINRLDIN